MVASILGVRVGVRMARDGARRTHDEPAMLYSFGADQAVRQLLNISRLAAKYDHLKAVLMIEMRMQRGYDNGVRLMLEIGELFRQ